MMFGLWFSLKVHGLQIGAPLKWWVSTANRSAFVVLICRQVLNFCKCRTIHAVCPVRGRVAVSIFLYKEYLVRFPFECFKRKIRTHLDLLSILWLGGKNVKTFRWDQRLQIQNPFMAFKRVPRSKQHWVNSIMSGRSPPLYCTFTLIAMQGHQKNIKKKPETM